MSVFSLFEIDYATAQQGHGVEIAKDGRVLVGQPGTGKSAAVIIINEILWRIQNDQ